MTPRQLIDSLVGSTGARDPFDAIRISARGAIEQYRSTFGEPTMPLNIDALASLLGILRSPDAPLFSPDAELVPVSGGVAIRVNPDRPETRQRFSVAHEVSHTFFPEYESKVWCRTDSRYRNRANPADLLEMLCDVGAAELVLPSPWFAEDALQVASAAQLVDLARKYGVSREAMLRRMAETHSNAVAAVFFSWKLKPTEERRLRTRQTDLFPEEGPPGRGLVKKLRVDYAIQSPAFTDLGFFVPADKSVASDGPLYQAACTGTPCEGTALLDFGKGGCHFSVLAIPVWTTEADTGPRGENAVAAIIAPVGVQQRRGTAQRAPLFE